MGIRNALNKEVSSSEDKNKTKIKTATTNSNNNKKKELSHGNVIQQLPYFLDEDENRIDR